MSERLRLFVALDLPQDVRHALAAWAAHAAPEGVRPVGERSLHLTLAFLGSRSQQQADASAALLPSVAAPVGELRTAGALWLGLFRSGPYTALLQCRVAPLQAGRLAWRVRPIRHPQ